MEAPGSGDPRKLFHGQARESGGWMAKGLECRGWVPEVLGGISLGD